MTAARHGYLGPSQKSHIRQTLRRLTPMSYDTFKRETARLGRFYGLPRLIIAQVWFDRPKGRWQPGRH